MVYFISAASNSPVRVLKVVAADAEIIEEHAVGVVVRRGRGVRQREVIHGSSSSSDDEVLLTADAAAGGSGVSLHLGWIFGGSRRLQQLVWFVALVLHANPPRLRLCWRNVRYCLRWCRIIKRVSVCLHAFLLWILYLKS